MRARSGAPGPAGPRGAPRHRSRRRHARGRRGDRRRAVRDRLSASDAHRRGHRARARDRGRGGPSVRRAPPRRRARSLIRALRRRGDDVVRRTRPPGIPPARSHARRTGGGRSARAGDRGEAAARSDRGTEGTLRTRHRGRPRPRPGGTAGDRPRRDVSPMRIGTRRSPLAIAQAEEVGAHLSAHGIEVELVPMTTSGDEGAAATVAGRRASRVCGSTRSSTRWNPVRSTWRCTRRRTCPPRRTTGS